MRIFTNDDIKRLFILFACMFAFFVIFSQIYCMLTFGMPDLTLLLLSLLLAAGVFALSCWYFNGQQQQIEHAISLIERFLSGDAEVRIESHSEGSLHKLFHAVNTLGATLNSHGVREKNTKEFLRNTISDISHQLKTPLAALAIYNSLIQDENEDQATVREFALKSEKELDRIETLVQNLLKITKLDAGSIIMDKQIHNIAEMMHDLKASFEVRAAKEQKEILLSGPQDASLLCDKVWLTEAVSNIVKNALDHTSAGHRICISWIILPAVTQIVVKDDGSGIHPKDIHHIFKRFYRSQFSKDRQGMGLGLPLSKAIVEAHGGNIVVDSVLHNGSAFVLSFLNLTEL